MTDRRTDPLYAGVVADEAVLTQGVVHEVEGGRAGFGLVREDLHLIAVDAGQLARQLVDADEVRLLYNGVAHLHRASRAYLGIKAIKVNTRLTYLNRVSLIPMHSSDKQEHRVRYIDLQR